MPGISLITIGNELLRGRIVNTNATEAAKILRKYGFSLNRVVSISDTREAILHTVEQEIAEHEIVILSGGLGPTRDDITKHTLLEWSNSEWVWHKETQEFLEQRFQLRKRAPTDLTRQQARVPSACEVIHNPNGTAPGMLFRHKGHMLFSFPGVPFEMLHLIEYGAVPKIREAFPASFYKSGVIRVADIPESAAAGRLDEWEHELPGGMSLAYLPRHDGLWLELSIQRPAEEAEIAQQILEEELNKMANIMQDKVYAKGDHPITEEMRRLFTQNNLTLGVAESLTGGNVSAKLVEVSGASNYYKGSVTAYAVSAKEKILGVPSELIDKYGVVSAEVAKEMAIGVRKLLQTDIGLGTTGFAQDSGEVTAHAFLGFADHNHADSKEVRLVYNRRVNIERCSNYLIQWCLKKVRETLD
ncbi:MAG: nicotinamide-nucleotide amidohydrolase family protein [Bacteroidota bacterium]